MKIHPFTIPKHDNTVLIYQEDIAWEFYNKLHQHNEIQISFIEKGNGTLLVGDSITRYDENDIIIIGSNLPHAFRSDKNAVSKSKMLSLFFTENSFGEHFFELNEFTILNSFFKKSQQGLVIQSKKTKIISLFKELKQASKMRRFIIFLEILELISKSKTKTLSTLVYKKSFTDIEGKKMRAVFDFTTENSHKTIYLEDVANVANMTKNAFCKYFKKRTNKTYISFLTELRIENACNLLLSKKEIPIAEVAYLVGFQNLSNFNRKFKEIKKVTPLQYRTF